jgi:hypothetical protein
VSLQIWVPKSADVGERAVVAREGEQIVDRCRLCGEFVRYAGEPERVMIAHVQRCYSANEQRIREDRERAHPEIMKPWDPEYVSWLRKQPDVPGRVPG